MILSGGRVFEVRSGEFHRLDVVIKGERVVDLTSPGASGTGPTVDVHGLYLLPGLIDTHVHLVMRPDSPHPAMDPDLPDDEVRFRTARAAERTVGAGITTVRDVGGWNHVEMAVRRAIERGELLGPRLFLAGRLLSAPTPAVDYYRGMYKVVQGPEEVRAAVRRELAAGADVIKVMATGAMLSPEDEDAHQTQLSLEELRAAVEEAGGVRVAAHAHARLGIERAVEAGVASIEHGTYADEGLLRSMAERGTFLVPTLMAGAATEDPALAEDVPRHIRSRLDESRQIHLRVIRRAHELGVPIAMGTDAGVPGAHHGANAEECLRMARDADLPPSDVLRSATAIAAKLLGRSDLGRLEPGALADVVAVEANPLDDLEGLLHPVLVVKGGTIVRSA